MLGNEIKRHREDRSLSQETLAELVGVSRQAVSKWEQGQALPTADNLRRLETALELEEGELSRLPLHVEDLPDGGERRFPKSLPWWIMGGAALLLLTFAAGLVLGNSWPNRYIDRGEASLVMPGPATGEGDNWEAAAAAYPHWPDRLELTREKAVDFDLQGLPFGEAETYFDNTWELTEAPLTYAGLTLALARTAEAAGPTLWVLGRAGEEEPWQVLDRMAETAHIPYQDFYEGAQWARPAGNVLGYDCIRVDCDGMTALFTLKEGAPRCIFRFFDLCGFADLDLDGEQEAVCREEGTYLIYDREVSDYFLYVLPEPSEDQLPPDTRFRFDGEERAFGFQPSQAQYEYLDPAAPIYDRLSAGVLHPRGDQSRDRRSQGGDLDGTVVVFSDWDPDEVPGYRKDGTPELSARQSARLWLSEIEALTGYRPGRCYYSGGFSLEQDPAHRSYATFTRRGDPNTADGQRCIGQLHLQWRDGDYAPWSPLEKEKVILPSDWAARSEADKALWWYGRLNDFALGEIAETGPAQYEGVVKLSLADGRFYEVTLDREGFLTAIYGPYPAGTVH